MHIDQCKHTFEELAPKVLPAHMERLNQAIAAPRTAAQFAILTLVLGHSRSDSATAKTSAVATSQLQSVGVCSRGSLRALRLPSSL